MLEVGDDKGRLDAAAAWMSLARIPQVDDLAFALLAGSLHRSQRKTLPSSITCENPRSLARSSA